MKNIFITGSNGFIGKEIVNYFSLLDGFNVISISHGTNNYIEDEKIVTDYKDVEWLKKIVNKFEDITVVHTAAVIPINDKVDDISTFHNNQKIDKFIVEVFQGQTDSFMYLSSVSIYGYGFKELVKVDEDSRDYIKDFYSKSKKYGELIVEKSFKKSTIFRISSPYSHNIINKGIFKNFIDKILQNNDIQIHGEGKRIQDFISILDINKIIEKTIIEDHTPGVYNLASGKSHSMRFIAKLFIKTFNSKISIESIDKAESYSASIENSKLKKEFKYEFESIQSGINKIYDDYMRRYLN